ncbi:MAG: FIST N-terminal domain-containing protein [Candidatus Kaelpia aquatica]|nr:FIST N-terminal domain-containing protein [Candidatus Kaelpia aquatica]
MALKIGTGISSDTNAYFAGKNAAIKALSSLGVDVPELGIAFSHYEYPILQINDGIKATLGEKNLVIINSQANVMNNTFKKRSVVLNLLSGHSYYHAISMVKNLSENPYVAGHHLAWGLLDSLEAKTHKKESQKKLALVFGSDSFIQKTELLRGLQEVLGVRFPIVGGIVSSDSSLSPTEVSFNRQSSRDGVVGILFAGENLVIGVGSHHGWIPLGLPKKIKKAEANRVQNLDDMSPLKYYFQYLGKHLDLRKEDTDSISTIYPLGLEAEKDNYVIRFPKFFEPGGSILLDSQVAENQNLRLMMGTRKTLLEATEKALNQALEPFQKEKISPKFIILVAGIERKDILGVDINTEINLIKKKVPETTKIIGIYTRGQFAPLGGSSKLANTSRYQNGAILLAAVGVKRV